MYCIIGCGGSTIVAPIHEARSILATVVRAYKACFVSCSKNSDKLEEKSKKNIITLDTTNLQKYRYIMYHTVLYRTLGAKPCTPNLLFRPQPSSASLHSGINPFFSIIMSHILQQCHQYSLPEDPDKSLWEVRRALANETPYTIGNESVYVPLIWSFKNFT